MKIRKSALPMVIAFSVGTLAAIILCIMFFFDSVWLGLGSVFGFACIYFGIFLLSENEYDMGIPATVIGIVIFFILLGLMTLTDKLGGRI